jgi:hypothetical protein
MTRINISGDCLNVVTSTMQSTGSRLNSPNPEQDTLLQPLNASGEAVTDGMPTAEKSGDERGMIDHIGLGLVYVGRTPFHHLELIYVGWLRGTCTTHVHLGTGRELCCRSVTSQQIRN